GNAGRLSLDLQWSHVSKYEFVDTDGTRYDFAGTHDNCNVTNCLGTPKDRINFGATWDIGDWSVSGVANYRGKFDNVAPYAVGPGCAATFANGDDAPGGCEIPSFTSIDLSANWRATDALEVFGSVQNATDRIAPLDPTTYGGLNYNPLDFSGAIGRFYTLGVKYSFQRSTATGDSASRRRGTPPPGGVPACSCVAVRAGSAGEFEDHVQVRRQRGFAWRYGRRAGGVIAVGLGHAHPHRLRRLESAAFADADDAAHLQAQRFGVHLRALLRLLQRGAPGFVVDRFRLVDLEAGSVDLVGAAGHQCVEHVAELADLAHLDADRVAGLVAGDRRWLVLGVLVLRVDVDAAGLDVLLGDAGGLDRGHHLVHLGGVG